MCLIEIERKEKREKEHARERNYDTISLIKSEVRM